MLLTPEEWAALRLSLIVATVAVTVSLPIAIMTGRLLARREFPLKWLLETAVNLPLVLPPVVTGYLLLVAFGQRGLIGGAIYELTGVRVAFTWIGAALAAAVVGFPLMVRAIRLSFESVEPRLELAAQSLGASPIAAFFRVGLPLASRGIIAGAMLAFGRSLGEFGATIMIAGNIPGQTQTIPLAIFAQVHRPGGLEQSWRLVVLSILLAMAALIVSGWFEARERRRDRV